MDFVGTFAAVDLAIAKAKQAYDITKAAGQLEAKEALVELREALVEVKSQNVQLREEVQQLEQQLAQQNTVVFENGKYWIKDGEITDGPFCPPCYDSNKKLIRLKYHPAAHGQYGHHEFYQCPICDYNK